MIKVFINGTQRLSGVLNKMSGKCDFDFAVAVNNELCDYDLIISEDGHELVRFPISSPNEINYCYDKSIGRNDVLCRVPSDLEHFKWYSGDYTISTSKAPKEILFKFNLERTNHNNYNLFDNPDNCPYCNSYEIEPLGKGGIYQDYLCEDCTSYFSEKF